MLSSLLSASLRLCAILLAATSVAADEPLTWKWSEGDTARYEMTQKMTMSMDAGPAGQVDATSQVGMVMSWAVEAVTTEGAQIRQATERIVMQSDGPGSQGFEYDSQDEDPPAGMAALIAPMFEAMVESHFMITMLPTGEYTDVTLSEELAEAFKRLPGGAVSADMVAQMSRQGALKFPEEPLALGDTWTTDVDINTPQIGVIKATTTYTYDGPREIDGREYEAFTPSVSAMSVGDDQHAAKVSIETTDSTGEILFDREAGRLFRSRVLQTMTVTVTIGEKQIVNKIEQAVELRALAEGEEASIGVAAAAEPEASLAE